MTRQIRLLTKLSLYGMFGFNEFRHTRDGKKKLRFCLMGALWVLLILMLAGYVGLVSYGLTSIGMGYFVPAVLGMLVSLVTFFFTMTKAGPMLFDQRSYEKQVALPVEAKSIIVSRFLSMYLTDMMLGLVVMLPGMAVYGVAERPGLAFYLYGFFVILFLPLLPLTAASVVGALIAGIAGRWKRGNLASILLTMIFMCVVLVGSMSLGRLDESQLGAMMEEMALQMERQIGRLYPPAIWISEAMVSGKAAWLLLFLGVSLGCFLIFLEILGRFYTVATGVPDAGRQGGPGELSDGAAAGQIRHAEPGGAGGEALFCLQRLCGEHADRRADDGAAGRGRGPGGEGGCGSAAGPARGGGQDAARAAGGHARDYASDRLLPVHGGEELVDDPDPAGEQAGADLEQGEPAVNCSPALLSGV